PTLRLGQFSVEIVGCFVNGELAEPERRMLEERMEQDAGFRARFLPFLLTELSILAAVQKAQWMRLRQMYQHPPRPKTKIRFLPWGATILAAAVVVFILVRGMTGVSPEVSSESLFAAYYEPYPLTSSTRSHVQTEEHVQWADAAMRKGDMQEALNLYQKALQSDSLNESRRSSIYMQMGTAYLTLDSLPPAIASFRLGADVQSGMWYEALIWLKMGKIVQVDSALTEILHYPEHYYFEKAKELQQELRTLKDS
ncbi:MAG: hypothetical protein AAFR59_01240, partial [Bacteroidota bacterium]